MSPFETGVSIFGAVLGFGALTYLGQQIFTHHRLAKKFKQTVHDIDKKTKDGKEVVNDSVQAQLLINLYGSFTLSRYASNQAFQLEVKRALWKLNVDPVGKLRQRLQRSLIRDDQREFLDVGDLYTKARALLKEIWLSEYPTKQPTEADQLSFETLAFEIGLDSKFAIFLNQMKDLAALCEGKKQIDSLTDEEVVTAFRSFHNSLLSLETAASSLKLENQKTGEKASERQRNLEDE